MRKKNFHFYFGIFILIAENCFAQDPPPNDVNAVNLSGNSTDASKLASTPVNYYTGIPAISIPLYNYSHRNGLSLTVSLDYAGAGGVKVNEMPSPAGLGWYLNAGGAVTRTVRGMPDDIPTNGFLYSSAIPSDYRPNGTKYYHDSLDAEQDIFQFSFNGRSGKFFIGKNKQVAQVPLSKLNITYTTVSGNNTPISTFTIQTEDGVKYVFKDTEGQDITTTSAFGYNGVGYTTAWYLSMIIAPFNTEIGRASCRERV